MVSFSNHLKIAAIVGAGGAVGSILRYLVSVYIGGSHETFPWHTFIVNTVGCFLMGALTEYLALYWSASYELKTFLTVGFWEVSQLSRRSRWTLETFMQRDN